ncbi:hypothetical protein GCM10029978_119720 [Actinoallomurus acanthiterrae]
MLKPDNLPVTFGKNDVEIIARETLYRGFFSLDLYRFRHRLFNGQMSHEVRREIFERGHAAVLLPFDPVRDEVVLIEQIRIAAYDTSETPWLLEMVAGMIEEGESVEDVARREAIEEAGLIVGAANPSCRTMLNLSNTLNQATVPLRQAGRVAQQRRPSCSTTACSSADGRLLGRSGSYRSPRTEPAVRAVHALMPQAELYTHNGVQVLISTLHEETNLSKN